MLAIKWRQSKLLPEVHASGWVKVKDDDGRRLRVRCNTMSHVFVVSNKQASLLLWAKERGKLLKGYFGN